MVYGFLFAYLDVRTSSHCTASFYCPLVTVFDKPVCERWICFVVYVRRSTVFGSVFDFSLILANICRYYHRLDRLFKYFKTYFLWVSGIWELYLFDCSSSSTEVEIRRFYYLQTFEPFFIFRKPIKWGWSPLFNELYV